VRGGSIVQDMVDIIGKAGDIYRHSQKAAEREEKFVKALLEENGGSTPPAAACAEADGGSTEYTRNDPGLWSWGCVWSVGRGCRAGCAAGAGCKWWWYW
jgi:hypothetical protein